MKKIIYSLVIMIAAGSLFTSCVNYDEPVGVQDLREAKASYLDALSGLRAADAEVQKSVAAINNAKAELEKANAAYRQAQAKGLEIANEQAKAEADQAIAKAKADAEEAALKHQYAMAQLNQSLEKLQKQIAAEALSLTAEEKNVIRAAINYYNAALTAYNTAAGNVLTKEQELWEKQNGQNADEETLEEEKARYEEEIADAKANIAQYQAWAEKVVNDPNIKAWQEYVDGLKAEATQAAFDTNTLKAQRIILESTTLKDAKTAAENAWAEWKKANEVKAADPKNVEYEAEMPASMNPAMKDLMDSYAWKITGTYPWNWSIDAAANNVENYLYGVEDSYSDAQKLGFKGIVETIEKSNLLEPDTTTVKAAEKKYNDAVAKYKAYADTLKDGFKVYLDSNKAYKQAVADTVEAFAKYVADTEACTAAVAKRDSIYDADTTAVSALFAAREALAAAVKAMREEGAIYTSSSYSTADIDSVLRAVKNFVTAKQAVFGEQSTDTLSYYSVTDLRDVQKSQIAILKLTAKDFEQTVDSIGYNTQRNQIYFKVSNQFTKQNLIETPNSIAIVPNSYQVSYTIDVTGMEGTENRTHWEAYKSEMIGTTYHDHELTKADIQNAKLSSPCDSDEVDEVFNLVFKALGLTADFWQEDNTWYDIVLADEYDRTELDPLFAFELDGEENTVGLTKGEEPIYKDHLYVQDAESGYPAYKFADYVAAEAAVKAADEKINKANTGSKALYEKSTGDLESTKDNVKSQFTALRNEFFGGANNIPSQLEGKDSLAVEIQSQIIEKIKDYITYVPANVGSFENSNIEVIGDVIAEVSASLSKYFNDDDDVRYFVFGHSTKPSLFGATVVADFNYTLVANSKDAKDYFAAVKEWVNGLEAAYKANVEAYEAANAEYYAYQEKAFGIKKQTDDETIYYHNYFDGHYNVYKAPKAGQQKAIYDQYLKAVVDQIKALNKQISTNDARIKDIAALLAKVEPLSAKALAIANNVKFTDEEIKSFATCVANLKTYIQNKIDEQEGKIDAAEWALKKIEAGVDTKTIAIEKAKRELDEVKAALAEAEQVLKLAKAEYDAVMAKYVK